jgi:hypothetical protein
MNVEMIDRLLTVGSGVNDQTIAILFQSLSLSVFRDSPKYGGLDVTVLQLGKPADMHFWYKQYVDRGLRIHIPKGNHIFILINNVAGNSTINDSAK